VDELKTTTAILKIQLDEQIAKSNVFIANFNKKFKDSEDIYRGQCDEQSEFLKEKDKITKELERFSKREKELQQSIDEYKEK